MATAATSPVVRTEVPTLVELPRPTAAPSPVIVERPGETSAPQPADDRRQVQGLAFYGQEGLALEYYWLLDGRGNLSALISF